MKNILADLSTNNKKIAVVAGLVVIAVYLDYTFILRSQLKSLNIRKEKILSTAQNIDKLTKDMAAMRAMQRKLNEEGAAFAMTKKIIASSELPLLLKDISDLANANQVRIMQMNPVKEAKGVKIKGAQEALAVELINIVLSCDYHRFGQFLNGLENSNTLLVIDEIKISPIVNDYFHQDISMRLKTYVKD